MERGTIGVVAGLQQGKCRGGLFFHTTLCWPETLPHRGGGGESQLGSGLSIPTRRGQPQEANEKRMGGCRGAHISKNQLETCCVKLYCEHSTGNVLK